MGATLAILSALLLASGTNSGWSFARVGHKSALTQRVSEPAQEAHPVPFGEHTLLVSVRTNLFGREVGRVHGIRLPSAGNGPAGNGPPRVDWLSAVGRQWVTPYLVETGFKGRISFDGMWLQRAMRRLRLSKIKGLNTLNAIGKIAKINALSKINALKIGGLKITGGGETNEPSANGTSKNDVNRSRSWRFHQIMAVPVLRTSRLAGPHSYLKPGK